MKQKTNDNRLWYREEYLKSDHWKELRARKLKSSPICEKCQKRKAKEPHHLNYRNIFDVTLDDLLSVCRDCHEELHREIDAEKTQLKEKLEIIRRKKESVEELGRAPSYPIMMDRHGIWVVTVKIMQKRHAEKRAILEREIGRYGVDLLGAAVSTELAERVGVTRVSRGVHFRVSKKMEKFLASRIKS